MSIFFRYPHTPHLAWLGSTPPREDKVFSQAELDTLLAETVIVEEKLDGSNLGISMGSDGRLCFQNRGQYLSFPFSGQYSRLKDWSEHHSDDIVPNLSPRVILFGEWLAARHSVLYRSLPDWFLIFDVYDRGDGRFWCTTRRDTLANRLGLRVVPTLFRGRTNITALTTLVTERPSQFGTAGIEGVIVRRDGKRFNEIRAKLVRSSFIQEIREHWRRRKLEWNNVVQI